MNGNNYIPINLYTTELMMMVIVTKVDERWTHAQLTSDEVITPPSSAMWHEPTSEHYKNKNGNQVAHLSDAL